jgi:hypothetical protein
MLAPDEAVRGMIQPTSVRSEASHGRRELVDDFGDGGLQRSQPARDVGVVRGITVVVGDLNAADGTQLPIAAEFLERLVVGEEGGVARFDMRQAVGHFQVGFEQRGVQLLPGGQEKEARNPPVAALHEFAASALSFSPASARPGSSRRTRQRARRIPSDARRAR